MLEVIREILVEICEGIGVATELVVSRAEDVCVPAAAEFLEIHNVTFKY